MSNIIIRNVNKDYIISIVNIQVDGWQTAYKGIIDDNFLNSMNRNERIQKMNENYQKNGFIVAEVEKEIVGFCTYIDNNQYTKDILDVDCELLAIYVRPDLKYKGIGTHLFKYVINEFRKKGKQKMVLWCLKDNYPSIKFYKKMGGRIEKERIIQISKQNYHEVGLTYNML